MNKTENIEFKSDGIINRFDGYRDKWHDFYPSEKWAFEKLAAEGDGLGRILDVGCALGGLGLALSRKFHVQEYVGVDINQQAIDKARSNLGRYRMPTRFEREDILKLSRLKGEPFDTVISLSCADWNINTVDIIQRCWDAVREGGHFIISLRLTDQEGLNDISRSYQPIAFDSQGNVVESANYVVFNWRDFLKLLRQLQPLPSLVSAYGYWGKPSCDAVTLYKELVFCVFIVRKSMGHTKDRDVQTILNLPLSLLAGSPR